MKSCLGFCPRVRYAWIVCLLVFAAPAAWAEPVTVESVQGEVEFRETDSQPWRTLARGTQLSLPAQVRAGVDSGARLAQAGSSFQLRSETRVTLEAPVDEPDGLVERVRQWLGTVLYRVERRPDEFRVETPFLVSTVKGTEFVVVSSQTRSFVTLLEGSLEIEDLGSGERQLMEAGDVIEAGEDSQMRSLQPERAEDAGSSDSDSPELPGAEENGFEAAEDGAGGETEAFAEELESLRESEAEQRGEEEFSGAEEDGGFGGEEDGAGGDEDGGGSGGEEDGAEDGSGGEEDGEGEED